MAEHTKCSCHPWISCSWWLGSYFCVLWCQWFFAVVVRLGITLPWDFFVFAEWKLGGLFLLESLLSSVCRFLFSCTKDSKRIDPGACYSVDLWYIHAVYLVALGLLPGSIWLPSCCEKIHVQVFQLSRHVFLSVMQNCLLDAEAFQPVHLFWGTLELRSLFLWAADLQGCCEPRWKKTHCVRTGKWGFIKTLLTSNGAAVCWLL